MVDHLSARAQTEHRDLRALHRGESALLAEMLGSERGLLHVDEPFDVFKAGWNTARLNWLKPRPHNEFFDLNDEERRSVRAFLSALAEGRTGLGVCRNPKFPFRADRMLLEIVQAPALVDWLAESFGLQVIRLLRHPAPQVLSVLRAGGRLGAGVYLERPNFLRGFLGEDQLEFGYRIPRRPIAVADRYPRLVHPVSSPGPRQQAGDTLDHARGTGARPTRDVPIPPREARSFRPRTGPLRRPGAAVLVRRGIRGRPAAARGRQRLVGDRELARRGRTPPSPPRRRRSSTASEYRFTI